MEFSTRASLGGGLKMRLIHKRLCTSGNYRQKPRLPFPGLTSFKKINLKCVKHVEFSTRASKGGGLKMRLIHKRLCTSGNYRQKPRLPFPGLTSFKKINLECVKHVEFSTRASNGRPIRASFFANLRLRPAGEQPLRPLGEPPKGDWPEGRRKK